MHPVDLLLVAYAQHQTKSKHFFPAAGIQSELSSGAPYHGHCTLAFGHPGRLKGSDAPGQGYGCAGASADEPGPEATDDSFRAPGEVARFVAMLDFVVAAFLEAQPDLAEFRQRRQGVDLVAVVAVNEGLHRIDGDVDRTGSEEGG